MCYLMESCLGPRLFYPQLSSDPLAISLKKPSPFEMVRLSS